MKGFGLILFLLISFSVYSQVAENSYRLYFTDKNYNNYTINKPSEFLSQKAIDRRNKYNIRVELNDLPVSRYYLDSLETLGLQIIQKSKWLNSVVVYTPNKELIDTITNLGFIKLAQKDLGKTNTASVNNIFETQISDLSILSQIYEPLDYGNATKQISMLNGHVLHLEGFKGQGITIGIIDGGFYNVDLLPAFDSLWYNNQILGTKDFVDGDYQVYDASSHGMKVLSIIGGNIPGQLVGTAPKANFWLLRSEETSTEFSIEEDNWVAAAEFADSVGCDIITSSLGYSEFDDSLQNYSYTDMDGNTTFITKAADIAASKGILVLNSAGNLGDDKWRYISAPGDGDSVLTVGAVDKFASYVSFSGQGPTYDGRIKPNVVALGLQTTLLGTDGQVTVGNGTSFSTPIVAGLAACLWQYLPNLNNMEIIKRIEESAHQYSNPDYKLGYGIPDFAKAASIISSTITSISDLNIVNISPNPFSSNIYIELLNVNKKNVLIELFNVTGQKLIEEKFQLTDNSITINNLNNLTSGMYILKITNGNQSIYQRIIKL